MCVDTFPVENIPLADETLKQCGLLGAEKLRLKVIDDDGVVGEKVLSFFRKAAAQLLVIAHVQPHQHRLVIALDLLGRLIAKATEQGIAAFTCAAEKIKFGFTPGDANKSGKLQFVIFLQRAVKEFKFPVWPAGDVENAVRPAAAIHNKIAAIIGESGFLRFRGLAIGDAGFIARADTQSIKPQTIRFWTELKAKSEEVFFSARP